MQEYVVRLQKVNNTQNSEENKTVFYPSQTQLGSKQASLRMIPTLHLFCYGGVVHQPTLWYEKASTVPRPPATW